MPLFTQAQATYLNMPLALLHSWEQVMNILWGFFTAYGKKEKRIKLTAKDNCIYFQLAKGHRYKIAVNMCNQSFLILEVTIPAIPNFTASITYIDMLGEEGIIKTVAYILTYSENVKKTK